VTAPTVVVGIDSDTLYPPYQQRQIAEVLAVQGTPADYVEVRSPHGHDGFLIESDQVGAAVHDLLSTVEKTEV
jgi:homoserine O-acetyltransferase